MTTRRRFIKANGFAFLAGAALRLFPVAATKTVARSKLDILIKLVATKVILETKEGRAFLQQAYPGSYASFLKRIYDAQLIELINGTLNKIELRIPPDTENLHRGVIKSSGANTQWAEFVTVKVKSTLQELGLTIFPPDGQLFEFYEQGIDVQRRMHIFEMTGHAPEPRRQPEQVHKPEMPLKNEQLKVPLRVVDDTVI